LVEHVKSAKRINRVIDRHLTLRFVCDGELDCPDVRAKPSHQFV
jgi:hypothetical protein